MRIIAVGGEKGGTGKTSVAVNLAAAFAQQGRRVLLIDLDAQASATHWLGMGSSNAGAPAPGVIGLLRGHPIASLVSASDEGIDLIPAHEEMKDLPTVIMQLPNSGLFALRRALVAASDYEVVVCDLPPARSPILATALAAATMCIAPIQPEHLVLEALRQMERSVMYAQEVNPVLQLRVLRNRYAPRSGIDVALDEEVRTQYASHLLTTIIPQRALIREAAGFQQSVFRASGSDAQEVRSAFRALAEEVLHGQ